MPQQRKQFTTKLPLTTRGTGLARTLVAGTQRKERRTQTGLGFLFATVRASPVPSAVRGSFVVKFSSSHDIYDDTGGLWGTASQCLVSFETPPRCKKALGKPKSNLASCGHLFPHFPSRPTLATAGDAQMRLRPAHLTRAPPTRHGPTNQGRCFDAVYCTSR